MAKIVWDKIGERFYETGVEQGVLYLRNQSGLYPKGVAWNGLVSVTESPSGAESTPQYADNIKYLNMVSAEEFGATIDAFTYPDDFEQCDGSAALATGVYAGQQGRKTFGLAYKTILGNDVNGNDLGYKLHLIYGAQASPSEKGYSTINDSPEAIVFSWTISTTPVNVTGFKPTASLVIDSVKADATKLAALEDILYGTASADPRLPLPDEVLTLFAGETPSSLTLVSSVPADGATGVLADADIVLTFNNRIASEAITVASSTGTIVEFTKSWDADGKVLTIDPVSLLTSSTTYLVTLNGVVDIYNQGLTLMIIDFTTAF